MGDTTFHDAVTGEIVDPITVRKLVGNDASFGTVAIMRDGSTRYISKPLSVVARAMGASEPRPVTGFTRKKGRAA
jgi:hypothetical protein